MGWFSVMASDEPDFGLLGGWGRRHVKVLIILRSLLALWIVFIIVFLCVKGYWWGLVFLPFLALELWLLRNLSSYARRAR
jgi:hypothetical protein